MSGFIIDLAALNMGLNRVDTRTEPSELDLSESQWVGEVQGDLVVDKTGERVSVRGPVRAVARLECARCLKEFDQPTEVQLTVFADRSGSSRGLEKELENDEYMKFHDGRRLDLREDAREALLVELPITPRCREDCRGLCPRCGADLNLGPCRCQE